MNDQHPILFNGDMVRAIIAGRKTQTRMVVRPQPSGAWAVPPVTVSAGRWTSHGCTSDLRCPYGTPGDLLWVREAWREVSSAMMADGSIPSQPARCVYRADRPWDGPWRPSIHMPRWASRITLEVADVRAQRVQEITVDDAAAEGFLQDGDSPTEFGGRVRTIGGFRDAWNHLYAPRGYGWSDNPWVWVVEFRKMESWR